MEMFTDLRRSRKELLWEQEVREYLIVNQGHMAGQTQRTVVGTRSPQRVYEDLKAGIMEK